MLCTVYKLRKEGLKLDREEAKATSVHGDLRVSQKWPSGMPCPEAVLYDQDGRQLMRLGTPELRTIKGKTIIMRGMETAPDRWNMHLQVWCCVLD